MNNSHISLILSQELGNILTEGLDKLEGGCVMVLERIVGYFGKALVVVCPLAFLTPAGNVKRSHETTLLQKLAGATIQI